MGKRVIWVVHLLGHQRDLRSTTCLDGLAGYWLVGLRRNFWYLAPSRLGGLDHGDYDSAQIILLEL